MQNQIIPEMEAGQATKDMQGQNWENLSLVGIETSKEHEG